MLLLVLVIWFPLLLMSYINSVYTSNLPNDATFSLTIGGYQVGEVTSFYIAHISNDFESGMVISGNDF